jgi:xanthine dehydrogenase YagT iron-sulfur-binding subunit
LSQLRGKPVILFFQSEEWDPSNPELLQYFRRSFIHQKNEAVEIFAGHASQSDSSDWQGTRIVLIGADGIVQWSEEAISPNLADTVQANPLSFLSRREFLAASAVATWVVMAPKVAKAMVRDSMPLQFFGPQSVEINLHINGALRKVSVEPRVSLLDLLRENLGLIGSKKGCDHGQCGACTVLIDGKRVNACLTLAIAEQGKKITTIEGLARGEQLHPVQAAFLKQDGFQCGFCTPGQIMSTVALLEEPGGKNTSMIKENMSGNICRCAAYDNIHRAVQSVIDGGDSHEAV